MVTYSKASAWGPNCEGAVKQMDLNRDGHLTEVEFFRGMQQFIPSFLMPGQAAWFDDSKQFLPGIVTATEAQLMFEHVDMDRDGWVTPTEMCWTRNAFMDVLKQVRGTDEKFAHADTNRDLKLSPTEWKEFLKALRIGGALPKIQALGYQVDTNKDGGISWEEVRAARGDVASSKPKDIPADTTLQAKLAADLASAKAAVHPSLNEDQRNQNDGGIQTATDLDNYVGVPATIEGQAEISIQSDVPTMNDIVEMFKKAMKTHVGAAIDAKGVEQKHNAHPGLRTVLVLWIADVKDGGSVQLNLLRQAPSIEQSILKAAGATTWTWSQCTFYYFGSNAKILPRGKVLVQTFGKKVGGKSLDFSMPTIVA